MIKKLMITFVAALGLFLVPNAHAAKMVQIKGSDTLINLVQRLAEVYMEKNPGKYIAVTGGGSGTGIAALINDKCAIANSSRQIKGKEIEMASDRGVNVKRVVVAVDGLSVITNKSNPIDKLTMDQIGKIFHGDITNWKEVGGKDMAITLYGRQSNSGTFDFFSEVVIKGDHSPKMNRMNGNAQIVSAVQQDQSGIGYVGVGYIKEATGINVLKVAAKTGGEYASPLDSAKVNNGTYPVSRPLNQYINGSLSGDILDFVQFELSPEGQKIVEEEGFFPITGGAYEAFNKQAGL